MIIIKINGRLGNHLFIHAFALAISKKFNTFYLLWGNDKTFRKYFKQQRFLDNYLLRRLIFKFLKQKKWPVLIEEGYDKNLEIVKSNFKNNMLYDGFFQSEEYFINVKEEVKKNFIIKKAYQKEFKNKFGELYLNNKILAIHCRIGDYVNWGNDRLGGKNLTLPQTYFINACNQIENISDYKIIVVTDDKINAKNVFSFLQEKIIVSESEIIDFQLIKNADSIIIANSTFSWWAAYLNQKNVKVYAPEYFVGFKINKEFPINIIPDTFIKVSVY